MNITEYLADLPDKTPSPASRRALLSFERRVREIEGFTGPLDFSAKRWDGAMACLPRLSEDQIAQVRRTRDVGPFLPPIA